MASVDRAWIEHRLSLMKPKAKLRRARKIVKGLTKMGFYDSVNYDVTTRELAELRIVLRSLKKDLP